MLGLFDAGFQFAAQFGRHGAVSHDLFAADQFAGFFENAGRPGGAQRVEGAADGRIGGNARRAVGTAADGADDQFGNVHVGAWRGRGLGADAFDRLDALGNGGLGAALVLDDEGLDRTARGLDMTGKRAAVKAFAAQADQDDAADIGMGAQGIHHAEGVFVGVATGKADQVDVVEARLFDDAARHVVRAFDQIGDGDDIADALAAVGAQIARNGGGAVDDVGQGEMCRRGQGFIHRRTPLACGT